MRIISILLLFPALLFAQFENAVITYAPNEPFASRVIENMVLPDGRIGMLKQSDVLGFQVLTTDKDGTLLRTDSIRYVADYDLRHCSFVHFADNKYYLTGAASKDDDRFQLSFSVLAAPPHTIELIDTLHLDPNELIIFEEVKYNPYFNVFEGFGALWSSTPSGIKANCYLSLDTQFHFTKYKTYYGQHLKHPILAFFWDETAQRYWLTSFSLRAIMLDADHNILSNQNQIRYQYLYNNITYNATFNTYGYFEQADGSSIALATKLGYRDPWQVSFVRLSIEDDTIIPVEVIPVNDPPLDVAQATVVEEDLAGDAVIAGLNGITFGTAPSKLTVAKFSKNTYQRIWELSFNSEYSLELWDMDIDEDNNIIIVGWSNIVGDGIMRGFLLKIRPDGTVDTHENFPIDPNGYLIALYPNPTTNRICLKTDAPDANLHRIWDMSGRLALELQDSNNTCVALPNGLAAGAYTAEIRLRNGQVAMRRFVVE
jgi:hypothetical protein